MICYIIILVLIILCCYQHLIISGTNFTNSTVGANSEQFANRREKAKTIYDWFTTNEPNYKKYRDDLNKGSNIVEYEDAYKLKQNNKLSVENIEKIL